MKIWLVAETCTDNCDFIVGHFDSRKKAIKAGVNHYCDCEAIRDSEEVMKVMEALEKDGYIAFPDDDEWTVTITEHEVY